MKPHILRLILFYCLLSESVVATSFAYDPPSFDSALIDIDALQMPQNSVDSLVETLTSAVCNFPESAIVDSDLQERALALALTLDPL